MGRGGRGKRKGAGLAFAAAAALLFVPGAFAETSRPVLWLGVLTEETEAKFNKNGVLIEAIDCAASDVTCVIAAIDEAAASGPRVLVAPPAFTATVIELYDKGLSQENVQGVVLLGPPADDIATPNVSEGSGASALLVLVEKTAEDNKILKAASLTRAFAAQGAPARLRFVGEEMLKPDAIHTMAVLSVLHVMGGDFGTDNPSHERVKRGLETEFAWSTHAPDNRKLRAQDEFVSTHPMRRAVKRKVKRFYRYTPHKVHQWPRATYDAFDLLTYRDSMAPGARYAVLHNRLGMMFVLDLEVYGTYKPEIVIGIDDEPNMSKFAWFFRTRLMYSWRDEKPNPSARPLGPFLSFRKSLSKDLVPPGNPVMALHLDGLAFSNENPFAGISDYPDAVQRVITKDNQCIYCHQIQDRGGRAHHLDAMTAQPQGGYALPLAAYSEEVMRQFLFDQEAVAAKFGVRPNAVDRAVADAFFAWTRTLTSREAQPEMASPSELAAEPE